MQFPRRILAACPQTGRWLDTGLVVPGDTYARLERLESSVFCPECAQIHRWSRETAALEEEFSPMNREGTTNGLC
jgi:hypothetical protein